MKDIRWDDFQKTPQLVEAGIAAAKAALPEIRELLKRPILGARGEREQTIQLPATAATALAAEDVANAPKTPLTPD